MKSEKEILDMLKFYAEIEAELVGLSAQKITKGRIETLKWVLSG